MTSHTFGNRGLFLRSLQLSLEDTGPFTEIFEARDLPGKVVVARAADGSVTLSDSRHPDPVLIAPEWLLQTVADVLTVGSAVHLKAPARPVDPAPPVTASTRAPIPPPSPAEQMTLF